MTLPDGPVIGAGCSSSKSKSTSITNRLCKLESIDYMMSPSNDSLDTPISKLSVLESVLGGVDGLASDDKKGLHRL